MQVLQIPIALLLASLLAPAPRLEESPVEEFYERILDSTLADAQTTLLKRVDFFEGHDTWDQAFVLTSQHYQLRTVGSRSAANKLIAGLELMLGRFQALLGTDFVPAQRFRIDVMPIAEYNVRGGPAAEHSSFYGSFLESDGRVAVSYLQNSETLAIQAIHSACHQFLQSAFNTSIPLWISEGLAAYFASCWNPEWSLTLLQNVSSSRNWIGMRELLSGSLSDYSQNGQTRVIELGMLFKYLLQFNENTGSESASPFMNFLRASVRGERRDTQRYSPRALEQYEQAFRTCEY
jgi:hypothetical protein